MGGLDMPPRARRAPAPPTRYGTSSYSSHRAGTEQSDEQ
jgi:hypothetical protein